MEEDKTVGNQNLISTEEEKIAAFLKERNLAKVNAASEKVTPVDSFYVRYTKRFLDLLISVPAFIILLPLNAIFAVCTFFDVGRPILYKQTRVGRDGKPFTMVKFRNMNNNTDADGKLLPAKDRITKFGKIMRKFSFDELLNFWSVIKGDMSIIGPRPLPEFFAERMSDRHKMRHAVRPGLECPRIYVPEGENLCQYHKQFENDIWYVEHVSFATDLKMCCKLIEMVFELPTRDKRAKGNAAYYFAGYDDLGHALSTNIAYEMYPEVIKK